MQLRGCGVEEGIALGLVAVELGDLLLVDAGKERNPVCEYALPEFLYICTLMVPEFLNDQVSI